MKILITLLLTSYCLSLSAADDSGNFAIWGAGKKSCFSYEKARNGEDDSYYRNYIMGYLTSYNAQAPDTFRISGHKNMSDILAWMDDYCSEKQVHGFDQALINFILEHYPNRLKKPPTSPTR